MPRKISTKEVKDFENSLTGEQVVEAEVNIETATDAVAEDLAEAAEQTPRKRTRTKKTEEAKVEEAAGEESPESPKKEPKKERRPAGASRYGNVVRLSGTIDRKFEGKKCTIVTLAVRANATMNNYPTVFFFGRHREKVKEFKERDRVRIEAHLNTYDEATLEKGQDPILVVGTKIEKAEVATKPREVQDVDGYEPIDRPFTEDENTFSYKGKVKSITLGANNALSITILNVYHERYSLVTFRYIPRDMNSLLQEIHINDYICALGSVQTVNLSVVPEPTEEDRVRALESAARLPKKGQMIPKVRTRRSQQYVLYDIYKIVK